MAIQFSICRNVPMTLFRPCLDLQRAAALKQALNAAVKTQDRLAAVKTQDSLVSRGRRLPAEWHCHRVGALPRRVGAAL